MTIDAWRREAAEELHGLLVTSQDLDDTRIVAVDRREDAAVVSFLVGRDRHLFARVVPWTHGPGESPTEWASEAWQELSEELGTGGPYGSRRLHRESSIELSDDQLPVDRRFHVSSLDRSTDGWWVQKYGFDPGAILVARDEGTLVDWLVVYVNSRDGEPVVGQAALVRVDATTARIESMDVSPAAPVTVLVDLTYRAMASAARGGFEQVEVDSSVPELDVLGLRGDRLRTTDTSFADMDVDAWQRLQAAADGTTLPRELLRRPGTWRQRVVRRLTTSTRVVAR